MADVLRLYGGLLIGCGLYVAATGVLNRVMDGVTVRGWWPTGDEQDDAPKGGESR